MHKSFFVLSTLLISQLTLAQNANQINEYMLSGDLQIEAISNQFSEQLDNFDSSKLLVGDIQANRVSVFKDQASGMVFVTVIWYYSATYDGKSVKCPGNRYSLARQCVLTHVVEIIAPGSLQPQPKVDPQPT